MRARSLAGVRLAAGAGAALALAALAAAGAPPPRRTPPGPPAPASPSAAGVAVAVLGWADRPVERNDPQGGDAWRRLGGSEKLRTGDRLRTSPEGVARLDFPWMAVTLGPSTVLAIPPRVVLSTVLERGRAEFSGEGRDIVKIEVGGAEIRGGGRLVLRREGRQTAASAMEGAFRIAAGGKTVEIKAGEGTALADGQPPPSPSPLPSAPRGLLPGTDPRYVQSGTPVELRWETSASAYHVEVLGMQGDDVLLARDTSAPPLGIEIPWLGSYRWRVFARDPRGMESRPSSDGYLCVVDR